MISGCALLFAIFTLGASFGGRLGTAAAFALAAIVFAAVEVYRFNGEDR